MKKGFSLLAIVLLAAAAAATVSAQPVAGEGSTVKEERAAKRSADESRRAARVLRVGPSTTYLKNGLSLDEVVMLLGKPAARSERLAGDVRLTTCVFARSGSRVLVAEFENGLLVSSRTEAAGADVVDNR
ncbi:MAG TPA: hypothetical protein VF544_10665 [Pyrinomonadaceae bacterium]